jgi:hypothetical protein
MYIMSYHGMSPSRKVIEREWKLRELINKKEEISKMKSIK